MHEVVVLLVVQSIFLAKSQAIPAVGEAMTWLGNGGTTPGTEGAFAGTNFGINSPYAAQVSPFNGDVYWTEYGGHRVRKAQGGRFGAVVHLGGDSNTSSFGFVNGNTYPSVRLHSPTDVTWYMASTSDVKLLVVDSTNNAIRALSLGTGVWSTWAGCNLGTTAITGNSASGILIRSLLMTSPMYVTLQKKIMYVSEYRLNLVRRISIVSEATERFATFNYAGPVTIFFGWLYVIQYGGWATPYLSKITLGGSVITVAGTGTPGSGTNPLQFNSPYGLVGDCARRQIYVSCDSGFVQSYHSVQKSGSRLFGTATNTTPIVGFVGPEAATSFLTTGLRSLHLDKDILYISSAYHYTYIVRVESTSNSVSCVSTTTKSQTITQTHTAIGSTSRTKTEVLTETNTLTQTTDRFTSTILLTQSNTLTQTLDRSKSRQLTQTAIGSTSRTKTELLTETNTFTQTTDRFTATILLTQSNTLTQTLDRSKSRQLTQTAIGSTSQTKTE
eukprot:PhF_6_TR39661/c2_g1_i1/m.58862